ncbi:iron-sulfur cluster carrier protein ApbC [Reinekea blandensis]|uniref:Iron-sulfur cluster carrier protein n=1 Tax=Reinekea blandensis MED297 TaxID=314283 RepID=A4BH79_9GAMM|nr:iron-sulfur cluster carrier protein ApbC [Reinekea blandensis]EAR08578.1 ATP-binding protein, Mrp/Nbp35 family [Reinekea sp. MED297] [Reinekea blandensis MED297]
MDNVKKIIAVASGKGGVGKSTTAVNLALALKRLGHNVGLLDADIYGPSVGLMLGVKEGTKPEVKDGNSFVPILAHGLQTMSMAYLVTDKTPMVWRGPMASGALQQILTQTLWDKLDYLVVDMPPGTGDIQLTLAQKANIDGAVIVTTPQDLALLDAKKGIEMFQKVNVPVLGVVENMAVHVCSNCGHEEHIFGEKGGQRLAEQYHVDILASLPLDMAIREGTDGGQPTMVGDAQNSLTASYEALANGVVTRVEEQGGDGPTLSFS